MSININNLRKSYGSQLVLDDISFSINSGEIVGFLGNNGAGKSTTMKIITGYVSKDFGEVKVCGIDVEADPIESHRKIGYLPEHNPIYPEMYVKEYLGFVAGLYKLGKNANSRVDEMIEKTGLTREYKKRIGQLSKGYRQRVGLAQALISDPEVLILDEPTTGLDPNQIIEVRELIKEVGREKTVMLSTHIMQEVSAICDRVIILNKGKIVADGREDAIAAGGKVNCSLVLFVEFSKSQDVNAIKSIDGVIEVVSIGEKEYLIGSEVDVRERVFCYAAGKGEIILTMKYQELNMEEAFRLLTK